MKKLFLSVFLSILLTSNVAFDFSAESYDVSLKKGDVNMDGFVNSVDSSMILNEYSLLSTGKDSSFSDTQKMAADVNSDGFTDSNDASIILSFYSYVSTGGAETDIEKWLDIACIPEISYPLCKAAAFYCIDDKNLLYNDSINDVVSPASLTKLLTASVALHYLSPDTIITVGTEHSLVKQGSSLCLIAEGHRLKLYDLLTGMLLASGNDAAYTVAVTTARAVYPDENLSDEEAVERFCNLMNGFAKNIGMENSNFLNPEGWDDENQYTTVKDLLTLADYAFSVPEIREITGTYQKYVVFDSGENITWTNSNSMLNPESPYYCSYAKGMKTGTTYDAVNCLIGAYEINGKNYISVVVGCDTNDDRYNLTFKLISELQNLNTETKQTENLSADCLKVRKNLDDGTFSNDIFLSAADTEIIKSYLADCNYEYGTCDCLCDYMFVMDNGMNIYYHSDCGTFNDFSNERSCHVPDDVREDINRILRNY